MPQQQAPSRLFGLPSAHLRRIHGQPLPPKKPEKKDGKRKKAPEYDGYESITSRRG